MMKARIHLQLPLLLMKTKETKKIIENVYLDNLISVIDENVEYCENYETKVRQWLRKQAV